MCCGLQQVLLASQVLESVLSVPGMGNGGKLEPGELVMVRCTAREMEE